MEPKSDATSSSVRREILARKLRSALTDASLSRAGFAGSLSRKHAAIDHLVPRQVAVHHDEGLTTMRITEADVP